MNGVERFAVIGAGPAGLAAASALRARGISVVLFDEGKSIAERGHRQAADLGSGVGGAGLYSDGKFSYFPSGSKLYCLADKASLASAYRWVVARLRSVGIGAIELEDNFFQGNGHVYYSTDGRKNYPSFYADLSQREKFIRLLSGEAGGVNTRCEVRLLEEVENKIWLSFLNKNTGQLSREGFDGLVVATGRLGSLAFELGQLTGEIPLRFLRYEFGLRIEILGDLDCLAQSNSPDVKYIWNADPGQFRTFCTCRRGEVWNIPYQGISALSGRSDGPKTSYSNFGLLARFEGAAVERGKRIWDEIFGRFALGGAAIVEPLGNFLGRGSEHVGGDRPWFPQESFVPGSIRRVVGEDMHQLLTSAVERLLDVAPGLLDRAPVCMFPAIEGVGYYPEVDSDLRIPGKAIWCAGDLVGQFRGLVPALVSGYFAGVQAANFLARRRFPSVAEDLRERSGQVT